MEKIILLEPIGEHPTGTILEIDKAIATTWRLRRMAELYVEPVVELETPTIEAISPGEVTPSVKIKTKKTK